MNKKVVLGIVGAVLLIFILPSINTLQTLDEKVNASWSQVENQYKRRADLVPNLVSVVKGYAAHENNTLVEVVEARNKAVSVPASKDIVTDPEKMSEFSKKQAELSGALGRLLAIAENYPDLKANQNFLALQSQLEGTENRISVARKDYIDAVREFNTALRTFPTIIWAKTFYRSLKAKEIPANAPATDQVPKVNF